MSKKITISLGTYLTYIVIFSPATIVIPLLMWPDKYFESGYANIHLFILVLNAWYFIYLYQELIIDADRITIRKIGLFGWNRRDLNIDDIVRCEVGYPHKVYLSTGEVVCLPWSTFKKKDKEYLLSYLQSIDRQ